jgi:predicted phage terminase large subunit-like protein
MFDYLINQHFEALQKNKTPKVTDDLLEFAVDTHRKLFNETFVVKPFHYEICDLLTRCALRKLDNYICIINMPPRYSKTQLIAYYVQWCFLKNPAARFIYATYSGKLSLKTSREIKKSLMTVHGRKSSFSKDSAELWETEAMGGFLATTMLGQVTGFGAGDIYASPYSGDVILDDPMKPADSFYETKRTTIIENFSQTFWSRRNNQDKVPIIVIQQRIHVDDLSGWLKRDSKYKYTSYTLKALDENGESSFPERVSKENLLELKEASIYTFMAQQQQDPQLSTGGAFNVEKIEIMSLNEFREERELFCNYWVRSWDLAGISKDKKIHEKHDWTRGVLMTTDGHRVYIVDLKSHRGAVGLNDVLITETALKDSYNVAVTIPEDPGSAGQHYVDYLQNLPQLNGISLIPLRPSQNKSLRAAPFASYVNTGRVVIVSDEEDEQKWNYEMLDEMRSFPMGNHDDIIDSCSDAFFMMHAINKYV